MTDSADRINRVITSVPVDRTAENVIRKGVSYEVPKRITQRHWDAPPQMKPVPKMVASKVGARFGRMVVVGYYGKTKRKGSLWVVRCCCGEYETRHTSAICKASNDDDCCDKCRHVKYLRRTDTYRQLGSNL
jgi:hypothetical protein